MPMSHRANANVSRIAPRIAVLVWPACLALGCAGYATVDGYDAEYVDPPPPAIVETPTYRVHDGYVYVVGGRYYHQHAGRWAAVSVR